MNARPLMVPFSRQHEPRCHLSVIPSFFVLIRGCFFFFQIFMFPEIYISMLVDVVLKIRSLRID